MAQQRPILFLDHTAALGGAELSLCDVARHFRQRAQVVLLEDGPLRERLEEAGVNVSVIAAPAMLRRVRRGSGLRHALGAAAGMAGLLARLYPAARRARLLYANTQKAFVIAACLGVLTRRPVLWHLRDMLSAEHFSRFNRSLTAWLAKLSRTRVIANSEATRCSFIDAGGSAKRAATVHNGISSEPYDAVPAARREALRAELGFKPGDFVVASSSRLAAWKGQHVLVEAVATLPNVHALIIGEALFDEDAYKRELLERIDGLGVADRVHLLGFRADVPELLAACDAVAHTSVAPEPFGRVIVEGMLARRPVIASDAGGAREIIEHEAHGLLVAPGDAAALRGAIERLIADPALRQRLAQAGRARAETMFSVEAMLGKLEQHLDRIMAGDRQSGAAIGEAAKAAG